MARAAWGWSLSVLLLGQPAAPRALAQVVPLHFQHITTDDGLSDNAITCVQQDRQGIIWIGTESGLDRFDGQRVDHVQGADHHISAFLEDAQGTRWIATRDHGLQRLRAGSSRMETFRHGSDDPRSIASDQLTALHDLNDTTILIGSRQVSLIFCDKRTLAFSYWTDSTSLSPARASTRPTAFQGWCHAIQALDEDRFWVGFLNFHQTLIADRRSAQVMQWLQVERPGSESQTTALLMNGTLYNGGWQRGVDLIDLAAAPAAGHWSPSPRVIDVPDEVLALVPWSDGRLIAGTRAMGLFLVDPRTGRAERSPRSRLDRSSLLSDRIRCLHVDRAGTLWVGSAAGLSRHVPFVWNTRVHPLFPPTADAPPELFFHRMEQDADSSLRIYTSDGFFLVDDALRSVRHEAVVSGDLALQPTVMGRTHEGRLLLGTEYGIVGYDPRSGVEPGAFEPTDGGGHTYRVGSMFQVRGIWPDELAGRPVMVVGSMGFGVYVIDARTRLMLGAAMPEAAASLNTRNLINCMLRTSAGTYWAGSANGAFSWSADQRLTVPGAPINDAARDRGIVAPGEDVRHMALSGDTLWAVTRSGALLSVAAGEVHFHRPPPALRTPMHGITVDHQRRLWISTDDGLLRFDQRTGSFLHVPVNDGRDFRKLTRAITTLSDGRIAFCADNTVLIIDPPDRDPLPALPEPYITSTSAAGAPLDRSNGVVHLSYRASLIDIGISAIAHGFPRPLVFEYRLDGVEDEWRSTSAREAIRYASVPVGSHRLMARVRDPFGRVSDASTLLTIHVAGPIWQQWWFYALALVLITSAIYALYNYRLAQAMKLQAVRNRIASDLHDEVGSSLSSITIGTQLAAQLTGEGNVQVRALLARMGETSSQSLRSMSDIVWAIDPKHDQGDALVKRMRRIAIELLESKGINVSFNVGEGVEELKLPMNARKELVLLYKEAVHNASKHSGAALVEVSLQRSNGALSMSVKDNGTGFDPGLHPDGHGLGSMRRRAEALGGQLDLVSAPGSGVFLGVRVDLTRIRD